MSTSALRLRSPDGVRAAVDALSNGHPVTRIDGGREPVWQITPEHQHAAAFYRNSVIHAFLETSIVELALAHAKHADGDRMQAFWDQAMRLRDLLKFDFYFADSATFRDNIAEEMAWHDNWEDHVAAGGDRDRRAAVHQAAADGRSDAAGVLRGLRDRRRRAARRPGGHRAQGTDAAGPGVGRQYVAQTRIRSSESVSTLLFATARQVVEDQDLIAAAPDLAERRDAFLRELRAILQDFDYVGRIAREQFVAREAKARRESLDSRPG